MSYLKPEMKNSIKIMFLFFALFLSNGLKAQIKARAKTLKVSTLSHAVSDPKDIPLLFKKSDISYHRIDQVNWETYPYKPTVQFAIAYTENALYLHYRVNEQHVKAVTDKDNGKVFEDACVEFFVQPNPNDLTYYNFEFNCIGKLLMQAGKPGKRPLATLKILNSIKRWSSLGSIPINIQDNTTTWELTVIIPRSTFYLNPIDSFTKRKFKGNFYKCGDKLNTPHYLSWTPIHSPKPQFHTVDFFGDILFE